MAQGQLSFRERVIEKFLQLTSPARAGAVSTYSALTAALYTQLASAYQAGGTEAVGALGLSLGSGVLTSLLASHLYDAQKPDDTVALLAKIDELHADESLHEEVEQHLRKLEITQEVLVQAIQSRGLSEADHQRIAATIRQELAHLDRAPAVDRQQEAVRQSYLNHLYEEAGEISFVGVDPQAAAEPNAPAARAALGDIYVPLLTAEAEREDMPGKDMADPGAQRELADPRARPERLSAIAQLNRHARLVLLGDPGSGKTTFARLVVQCLAGEACEREMNLSALTAPAPGQEEQEAWSHGSMLPVIVELRKVAAVALPPVGAQAQAGHLVSFLTSELETDGLAGFAPQLAGLLRYPGGLVVLDGLDEVPEAEERRTQILQVIEDFAALYPNCRLLVTSRTYSYLRQGWRLRGFHEAELIPFGREQIESFVDRWYEHTVSVRRRQRTDAQGRASRLKEAIRTTPRLAELAARPLLLTLMAALHDWRGGDLPEKRWQLYEETVDLLLERWNRRLIERDARGEETVILPDLAAWLQVDRARVRQLLHRLAYEAHESQPDLRGTADIPEEALVTGLFDLARGAPEVSIARIVDFLKFRAGLLIAHGDKVYTVPHRTLQEYLAACHLTDDPNYPETLAELARSEPDRWREVALLAGGKAAYGAQSTIWELADALCQEECPARGQPECEAWGAMIAGLGLLESAKLDVIPPRRQRTITRLQRHLAQILEEGKLRAIERASAGRILGQLGDARPGVGIVVHTGLPDILWCAIPAGPFTMGSSTGDADSYDDERPQHDCDLTYDYSISKYPITAEQYQAFVEAEGYAEEDWWTEAGWRWRCESDRTGPEAFGPPFSTPNHPVVGVAWYEAQAFTRWLSAQIGADHVVDLPSEAEWEKAARGSADARRYPWGDDLDPDRANFADTGIGSTSAVGCFPGGVSPYGMEDCIGNVWEWTRSLFASYEYVPGDGRENPEGDDARVVRGGSWSRTGPWVLRDAFRFRVLPGDWDVNAGFRCVLRPPGQ